MTFIHSLRRGRTRYHERVRHVVASSLFSSFAFVLFSTPCAAMDVNLTAAATNARESGQTPAPNPITLTSPNLGLRDAHALADALSAEGPTPLALATFAQRRALDRRMTIGATDTLARLFTIDFAPLAIMRGLALTALEFLPPVKTALARQMMFGQRR